jgi:hypothetical protein
MNTSQALEKMRLMEGEDVKVLADFLARTERGVIK